MIVLERVFKNHSDKNNLETSFPFGLRSNAEKPLRASTMRIDPIDGRRNARGICHAQKYYVIYLEG